MEQKEKRRKYYLENKEKYKKWRKKWHDNPENKSYKKEKLKEWRENNVEYLKEYSKNRYEENKDSISESKKNWRKNNKDKINEYRRNYQKERLKNDPLFKLKSSIRNRINSSFKRGGFTKRSKTGDILGCTFEEFKIYLEPLFVEEMSWENQGEWHLDHIMPISLAKTEEEVIKLNHYTNFQPLWAEDNVRKSNKYDKEREQKINKILK
jgi:hypothetical protein